MQQYQLNLIGKHPEALTAAIIKASMDIDSPAEFEGKDDKEKQFNRKVELNAKVRELVSDLAALSGA